MRAGLDRAENFMNIDLLTIDRARDLVARKETTATALAEAFYGKIATEDEKIGAFLTLSEESRHGQGRGRSTGWRTAAIRCRRWPACRWASRTC